MCGQGTMTVLLR